MLAMLAGPMRIDLPPALWRELSVESETVLFNGEAIEVTVLDGGMGPVRYLSRDGQFLVDGSFWEHEDYTKQLPIRLASDDEACIALVIGAEKRSCPRLLEFLPPAPRTARTCPMCEGSRRQQFTPEVSIVCQVCAGRGWAHQPP